MNKLSTINKSNNIIDTTDECMRIKESPQTPENVRKYRKSYFDNPGTHCIHYGLINDHKLLHNNGENNNNLCFGTSLKSSTKQSDNILNTKNKRTDYQIITEDKKNNIYATSKSEILGKTRKLNYNLPQNKGFVFGIKTINENPNIVKDLLYPLYNTNTNINEPKINVGEQKKNNDLWNNAKINPNTYTFGGMKKDINNNITVKDCIYSDTNNTIINKRSVEDYKLFKDQLGKPRHLGVTCNNLPSNYTYGKNNNQNENENENENENVKLCLQSTKEELHYDYDLGKPVHDGWKNETLNDNFIYGVSTLKNKHNNNDEIDTKSLLYPDIYASRGILDKEFFTKRSKNEIKDMFINKMGYNLDDDIFNKLYNDASELLLCTEKGQVSIEEFRIILNKYIAHEQVNKNEENRIE